MSSPKARRGAGIREFLKYYLPLMLDEGPMTKEEMVETIKERSSDNERFRPGSSLLIDGEELNRVLQTLLRDGRISAVEGDRFILTEEGRKALQRMNELKGQVKNSKEEATAKLISILTSDAGEKAGERYVLDVGTGEGYLAFKLAEAGFKVLGIDSTEFDYSRDSIKKASERARGNPNLEFRVADVRELGMEETFDYVVSSQAIHCMKVQRECICSIYRLLKRGGLLVVSDFLVGLKAFFAHGFHSFLALSREEWEEILPGCGYVGIKIHEMNDFCVVEARRPT